MLDQRFIRTHPDRVREAIRRKNERVDFERYLALDARRRRTVQQVERLKKERNAVSEEIADRKRRGEDASGQIAAMRAVARRIKRYDHALAAYNAELHDLLIRIPNIPHPTVPVGADASDNEEVRRWGSTPDVDFERKPHWEIGARLRMLDFQRGGKIAGSRFPLFTDAGARLERALIQFMLDLHVREHGYTEVIPPFLANRASLFGTGQLPNMEPYMYRTATDDFFLIPTAEVPITNIHRDEILAETELPVCYVAYSPCFRREAGSHGLETKGLIRVHQFDKIELVKFVKPDTSYDELETLVRHAEAVLQRLNLPYRVMRLCTGELSFAGAKGYDLEVWAPGVERWLEVSSCSNFEDFQARRCNIRYRTGTGKTRLVHTLNGSGVALARTVAALIEHGQTAEGAVRVPEALQPYMGGMEIIRIQKGGRVEG